MNVPFDSLWLEVPESPEVSKFLEGPQPPPPQPFRPLPRDDPRPPPPP